MFDILDKYTHNGSFVFCETDDLADKCNAPKNKSGVYIVFNQDNALVYIGRSGEKLSDGTIKHRIDGIYGRLVKGKQFGESRKKSWPQKMKKEGFSSLRVFWYNTENDNPEAVESILLHEFNTKFGAIPIWNGQMPRDRYEL